MQRPLGEPSKKLKNKKENSGRMLSENEVISFKKLIKFYSHRTTCYLSRTIYIYKKDYIFFTGVL